MSKTFRVINEFTLSHTDSEDETMVSSTLLISYAVTIRTHLGPLMLLSGAKRMVFQNKRMSSFLINDSKYAFLKELGLGENNCGVFNGVWSACGPITQSLSPSNNKPIANVSYVSIIQNGTVDDCRIAIIEARKAYEYWADVPSPRRGEIVRQIGDSLRSQLTNLGKLMGKIVAEGVGEVQEYVDICDYATGLSRSLNGQIMPSERPGHALIEQWNPLGYNIYIFLFLFVGFKNLYTYRLVQSVLDKNNVPGALCSLVCGEVSMTRVLADVGHYLVNDKSVNLVSFTGSTEVGRIVGQQVQGRFGKSLLELGGNNAIIVNDDADLDMVVPATVFAAVGTAGQRCTSTRRLIVHESIYEQVIERIKRAYAQFETRIGDPLDSNTIIGPLHDEKGVMKYKISKIFMVKKRMFHTAVIIGNTIYYNSLFRAFSILWIIGSPGPKFFPFHFKYSKCLQVDWVMHYSNINRLTCIQNYLFRSTCTINYSKELPLAQGIKFE
uniref:aldehyde dehydrogenase (NAD(+)) n=1 Tax=Heterorhabditis bacteriophora TaxID=37862 RepID=A0A1I7X4T6_HETBA